MKCISPLGTGGFLLERQNDNRNDSVAVRPKLPPRIMLILFLVSLPLVNPWVRGDGVGYYAFARALLIQRNLNFEPDYQHANQGFRKARLDAEGDPKREFRTATGHLDNHFTIGPAMLWAPFLICAHAGVLMARALGAHVSADGFSLPYLLTMAIATVLYGFLALVLSYRVASRFAAEPWALFATIAIWWASSLPVYMYFNPSWSHAHSAFAVALFFWYWLRTAEGRSGGQWFVLALLAGLMLNVYYPNVIVLVMLIPEALAGYLAAWKRTSENSPHAGLLLARHVLFCAVLLFSLLPTFLTRQAVYGGFFETGYVPVTAWAWGSPSFFALLFSSNHGLFSWTPLLAIATFGLFLFWRRFPSIGLPVMCALFAFYYFMASYPDWPGISSYGNRFFVSLTIFFVLGLAVTLDRVSSHFRSRRVASLWLGAVLSIFVIWNLGLIFQWGAHLIPARGAVSWREVTHNQFHAVPREIVWQLESYLFRRRDTLHEIERRDIEQLDRAAHP